MTVRWGGLLVAALTLAGASCTGGAGGADRAASPGATGPSASPTASSSTSADPSDGAEPFTSPTANETIPLPTPTSRPAEARPSPTPSSAEGGVGPQEPAPTSTGEPTTASSALARSLRIVAPDDGATVDNPVTLEVEVSGFELVELGGDFRQDEGHLWAFVDEAPPPERVVLPESTSVHKSAETTIDLGELPPGEHTVTVVASHGYPVPFDPRVDDVVTFTVTG